MMRLLRALTQVLQIWWTKDRIRVARSEGKLFRIHVGDRLLIGEQIFIVTSRHEGSSSSVADVDYGLELHQVDSSDNWKLTFTMSSEFANMFCNLESREISCDQVVVLK